MISAKEAADFLAHKLIAVTAVSHNRGAMKQRGVPEAGLSAAVGRE
jgi:hypothetical protein